jgi:acetaldehyde dehydrogenase/alcohol dehydrogenase
LSPFPPPDYTRGLAKEAIRILFKYLPTAYASGDRDLKAREKVGGASGQCVCM